MKKLKEAEEFNLSLESTTTERVNCAVLDFCNSGVKFYVELSDFAFEQCRQKGELSALAKFEICERIYPARRKTSPFRAGRTSRCDTNR